MATRQYIGARYVPKFYDYNGSPNWRAGVEYENLTIVTRNGNSYTSKKPVPSSIGEPENNPEYWVSTGMYNEQVEAYRQLTQAVASRVEEVATDTAQDIADEASAREQADSALGERITDNANTIKKVRTVSNRSLVLIGDSYNSDLHYSWGKKVIQYMGLTEGTNAWCIALPGAGFGTSEANNFYVGVQNARNLMTAEQALGVTDVVIQGGINDYVSDPGTISTRILLTETYVKTNFPHAKMWIICAGWGYENDEERPGALTAYNQYFLTATFATVINRAYVMFLFPGSLENDMVHPTETSSIRLAHAIMCYLNGGNLEYVRYTDLNARVNGMYIKGDITPYGTHIYMSDYSRVTLPVESTLTNTDFVTIATFEGAGSQNFFFRKAEFVGTALVARSTIENGYLNINCVYRVIKRDGALVWDVQIQNRSIAVGGDFPISNVVAVYPMFDVWLDITKT